MSAVVDGEWTIITPDGAIDASNCADLKDALLSEIESGKTHLQVDMTSVPFIDSSGLGTLVGVFKSLRVGGGDLRLSGLSSPVRRLFELTRLDQVFAIL